MIQTAQLLDVVSDLARDMVVDLTITDILDSLVESVVKVLPIEAAAAKLSVLGAEVEHYAASSARYDEKSAPNAVVPMGHGDNQLGQLLLYGRAAGGLQDIDRATAQVLADLVSAYVWNSQARHAARRLAARFESDSLHDSLTGLANRRLLFDRLQHAASRVERGRTGTAVLYVDLDDFKAVNDAYGHQVGDKLLVGVAERLAGLVRPSDTLARLAGDEFVFLCEDLIGPRDAEAVVARVGEAFRQPFAFGSADVRIAASVGVAFAWPDEEISENLIWEADRAMYRTKRTRRASNAAELHANGEALA